MQVIRYEPNMPPIGQSSVVALGFFDGVHLAHRRLIDRARAIARQDGLTLAVFTFVSETDGYKESAGRLYSTKEKLSLFSSLGVELVLLADFSSLRDLSPEAFVDGVLVHTLGARVAVAGYNFRYGKGASGNADTLLSRMRAMGGDAVIEQECTEGGETVSSTRIRRLLTEGKTEEANRLLVTPYFLEGTVESGRGMGRTWGIPTVNLPLPEGCDFLCKGVYRAAIRIRDEVYHAVTNVGTCPTFGAREVHTETHVLNCDLSLYGECVRVYLLGYLREERVFSGVEELKMQINVDKNRAIQENGDIKWLATGQN